MALESNTEISSDLEGSSFGEFVNKTEIQNL
jgi:hypothetical protein